jgi:serine phosphatase RsbU (regulator of sigma subunit)
MADRSPDQSTNRPPLTVFLAILLGYFLPIFVPWMIGDLALQNRESQAIVQIGEELEGDWNRLQFRSDPMEILTRFFHDGFAKLAGEAFQHAASFPLPERLNRVFHLQAASFDRQGKMTFLAGSGQKGAYVIRKLWSDLKVGLEKNQEMYWAQFGSSFSLTRLRRDEGIPISLAKGSNRGVFLWKSHAAGGGLIVYCPQLPSAGAALKYALSNSRADFFRAGYDPVKEVAWSHGKRPAGWRRALRTFLLSEKPLQVAGDSLFFCRKHVSGFVFLSSRPIRSVFQTDHRVLWGAGFLGLGIMAVLSLWRGRPLPLLDWKIEGRVLYVFVLSILFPFAYLFLLSNQVFSKRFLAVQNQVHVENIQRLRVLEGAYLAKMERSLVQSRKTCEQIFRGENLDFWRHRRIELRRQGYLTSFEAYMADGTYFWDGATLIDRNFVNMFKLFLMNRYLGISPPEVRSWVGQFVKGIIMSRTLGFPEIFDRTNEFNVLSQNQMGISLFFDVRKNPVASLPDAFILAFQPDKQRDVALTAMAGPGCFVYDHHSRRFVVHTPDYVGHIEDSMRESLHARKSLMRPIIQNGEQLLVTLFPSTQTAGVLLITAQNLTAAQHEILVWKLLLAGCGILALLTVWVLARLLARSLHRPLVELTRGVRMLELNRWEYRVPVLGADELGRLAVGFNRMMEDFSSVQGGRTMQAQFMPNLQLEIPGFEVAFFNRPATDLGGDFCDILPLPDGRWLLALGDVTGHGISAAMPTAIAKIICQECAVQGCSLEQTIVRLNNAILITMNRKRMMTFWAGILDPVGGTLEWTCIGHLYPLLKTPEQGVQELAMPNVPLGAKRLKTVETRVTSIPPAGMFATYSDGIVEAVSADNRQFGFERIKEILAEPDCVSATGFLANLLKEHAEWEGGAPPADDSTVLVLRRKS